MHYQRMSPQPYPYAIVRVRALQGRLVANVTEPGKNYDIAQPPDMPSARPWQASDGEWFWRRALCVGG